MKIIIPGDLHGEEPEFTFREFDTIISAGDFCPASVRDLIYKGMSMKQEEDSEEEWYDLIGREKVKSIVKKALSEGRSVLEELNSFNKSVYVIPGNWDWSGSEYYDWSFLKKNHYKELIKGLGNIIDTQNKLVDVGDYEVIGYGKCSGPEYPQENLEDYAQEELSERRERYEKKLNRLNSLFNEATKPVIFLTHNVPYNTPLDKIDNEDSPKHRSHWGSVIAKELIEEHQPLVCISGHMHENFGKCRVRNTLVINAGYGSEVNTLLKLQESEVKKVELRG